MIFPLFPLTGVHIDHYYSKYELYSFEDMITKSSQEHLLCMSLHIGLHINNTPCWTKHNALINMTTYTVRGQSSCMSIIVVTAGVVFKVSFIFYCVRWVIPFGKFHFICIACVHSCVFHMHLGRILLDLELQKWPHFCISRCCRSRFFFFDRDRVIVDRELQGPL